MALALLLSILAARDARLSAAVDRYELAKFAAARDALVELIDDPALTKQERADVRTYLAACYLALSDKGSARLQLRALEKEQPEARPPPATFTPELNALVAEVWSEGEKRRSLEATQEKRPPSVTDPPPEAKRSVPPRALAIVPFGIGHFARGDAGQGAFWLGLEAVLFAIAIGVGVQLETMKLDGYPKGFEGHYALDRQGEVNTLRTIGGIAFYGGLVAVLTNIIVAFATWPEDAS